MDCVLSNIIDKNCVLSYIINANNLQQRILKNNKSYRLVYCKKMDTMVNS